MSDGAFTAASESSEPNKRAVSDFGSGTASIDPAGSRFISRARAATSANASSGENTPARQAATNSPTLWPIIACGLIPQPINNLASAYSITNSAGWVVAVWFNCCATLSGTRCSDKARRGDQIRDAA